MLLVSVLKPTNASRHVPFRNGGRPTHATPLLHIHDRSSSRKFLIDTGAEVSVFPASGIDLRSGRTGPFLRAANGTPIRTFGTRFMPLTINSRLYKWEFIIADVAKPLLGASSWT